MYSGTFALRKILSERKILKSNKNGTKFNWEKQSWNTDRRKEKDTLEITELLNAKTGEAVKVNGAVHTIRDMGTVAFVILRKREGLLQCVYEKKAVPHSI